jgi:general secretion pathway protein I
MAKTMKCLKRNGDWIGSRDDRDGRVMASCPARRGRRHRAFTLIEVTIAAGILFICLFAVLELLSSCLRNARSLQHSTLDAGQLAAEASISQKLIEGSDSGDFGDLYPGYHWRSETNFAGTNGLFEVDFTIFRPMDEGGGERHMSILLFRPESPVGPGGRPVR